MLQAAHRETGGTSTTTWLYCEHTTSLKWNIDKKSADVHKSVNDDQELIFNNYIIT